MISEGNLRQYAEWTPQGHVHMNGFPCPICDSVSMARELLALRASHRRAIGVLTMLWDKWENGVETFSVDEDGGLQEDADSLGNAFRLTLAEQQTILNLIVLKCEPHEQPCANCNKPYRAHLLHDQQRCSPDGSARWFPGHIAEALAEARKVQP